MADTLLLDGSHFILQVITSLPLSTMEEELEVHATQ